MKLISKDFEFESPLLHEFDASFRSLIDDGVHIVLATEERGYWVGTSGRCNLKSDPGRSTIGIDGESFFLDDGSPFKICFGDRPQFQNLNMTGIIAHGTSDSGWFGVDDSGKVINEEGLAMGFVEIEDSSSLSVFSGDEAAILVSGKKCWSISNQIVTLDSETFPDQVSELFWYERQLWGWRTSNTGVSAVKIHPNSIGFQSNAIPRSTQFKILDSTGIVYAVSSVEGTEVIRLNLADGSTSRIQGGTVPFHRTLDVAVVAVGNSTLVLFAGISHNEGRLVCMDAVSGATKPLSVPNDLPLDWQFAQWMVQGETIWLGIGTEGQTWLLEYRG